jgi:predicted MFS family arabinose efflux permease
MADFHGGRARFEFIIVSAVTFLAFLTASSTPLLAVALRRTGLDDQAIGPVLAAGSLPVAVAALFAGRMVSRFGDVRLILLGTALMAATQAALEFVHSDASATIVVRALYGVGCGIMVPAGMFYAQARLTERRYIYFFGVYSTMLLLPNLVGPGLAELYLERVGTHGFFLVTAAPAMAAFAVMLWAARKESGSSTAGKRSVIGYLAVLQTRDARLIYPCSIVFGAVSGFSAFYMAMLLERRGIAVSWYFSGYTALLIFGRFVVLSKIQMLSRDLLIVLSALMQGLAYLLLWTVTSTSTTLVAGILYGLGQSVTFPALMAWGNSAVAEADRSVTTALVHSSFVAGITLCGLLGGIAGALFGIEDTMLGLSVLAFIAAAILAPRLAPTSNLTPASRP